MRILFLIQGEGRGHMTQAISLKTRLEARGHEIRGGVGISKQRAIPSFFSEQFGESLFSYLSPNFITDSKGKGLQIGKSIWVNLLKSKTFLGELEKIKRQIKEFKPDAIINFYEPLGGIFCLTHKVKANVYGIGHQFLFLHPDFERPKGKRADQQSLAYFTKLTGYGCKRWFGLSFYSLEAYKRIIPIPPLLRNEIKSLEVGRENFFMAYLLNKGYQEEIINWSKSNPGVKIECFTDGLLEGTTEKLTEDLSMNGLSGERFLELLAKCKGLVCTAGFESVCEAMFLEKPVMMVPVENHYEQFVNSRDGFKAGAGVFNDHFDLKKLIDWMGESQPGYQKFHQWIKDGETTMINYIEEDFKPN